MLKISLNNVKFTSNHGLYNEEEILGNTFIVNATATCKQFENENVSINNTVNYGSIFEIVEKFLQTRTDLLETLTINICNEILAKFSLIVEIEVCITKKNPPIKNFNGDVTVCYKKYR